MVGIQAFPIGDALFSGAKLLLVSGRVKKQRKKRKKQLQKQRAFPQPRGPNGDSQATGVCHTTYAKRPATRRPMRLKGLIGHNSTRAGGRSVYLCSALEARGNVCAVSPRKGGNGGFGWRKNKWWLVGWLVGWDEVLSCVGTFFFGWGQLIECYICWHIYIHHDMYKYHVYIDIYIYICVSRNQEIEQFLMIYIQICN